MANGLTASVSLISLLSSIILQAQFTSKDFITLNIFLLDLSYLWQVLPLHGTFSTRCGYASLQIEQGSQCASLSSCLVFGSRTSSYSGHKTSSSFGLRTPSASTGGSTCTIVNLAPNFFLSWETWKVGWIRADKGSPNLYAMMPTFCKILKELKYRGESLRCQWVIEIYLYGWSQRYTQSSISNSCSFLLKSAYFFICSCAWCRLWCKICSYWF